MDAPSHVTEKPAKRLWRAWHFVGIAAVVLFVAADVFLLWAVLIAGYADPPATSAGWTLREGEGQTLYAVSAPTSATVNVAALVVACEVVSGQRILQLQLFVDGDRPLLPVGARQLRCPRKPVGLTSATLRNEAGASAAALKWPPKVMTRSALM